MNLSRTARRRAASLGALIAPVLLVQFVKWVFDAPATPAGANAAVATAPDAPMPAVPVGPNKEQQALLAWIGTLGDATTLHSPMDHGEPKAAPGAPPSHAPVAPVTAGDPNPEKTLASRSSVGAVFGSSRGQMATINGRVYEVGDEVAPGWKIVQIDLRESCVRLIGPADKKLALPVKSRDSQ